MPVLGKAADVPCRLLCAAGCSVHGCGQPQVCREYACFWLEHEELPDAFRPDKIGLVVTESGTIAIGGKVLSVFVLNETVADAHRGPVAAALIDDMLAQGHVLLLIFGLDMQILYDRRRWMSISPEQIEAAYRQERLRDAEELKRLGAVSDDFCH